MCVCVCEVETIVRAAWSCTVSNLQDACGFVVVEVSQSTDWITPSHPSLELCSFVPPVVGCMTEFGSDRTGQEVYVCVCIYKVC